MHIVSIPLSSLDEWFGIEIAIFLQFKLLTLTGMVLVFVFCRSTAQAKNCCINWIILYKSVTSQEWILHANM